MEEAIKKLEQLMISLSDTDRNNWSKSDINSVKDELLEIWQILNEISVKTESS